MEKNNLRLTKEEAEALYKIVKEYEKDAPEGDKEYYDDYYDEYKTPIKKKIMKSIINKINNFLPKKQKEEIDNEIIGLTKKEKSFRLSFREI